MDLLDRLPEITDHVLSGLKADEDSKRRILLAATETPDIKPSRRWTVAALCSLSVLLVVLCLLISNYARTSQPAELQVIPAGSHRNSAPVNLHQVIDEASELVTGE